MASSSVSQNQETGLESLEFIYCEVREAKFVVWVLVGLWGTYLKDRQWESLELDVLDLLMLE